MIGRMIFAVYDLEGNYVGITQTFTYSTNGANDWKSSISVPQDKTYQVKVWMAPTLVSGTDEDALDNITARYYEGSAANLLSGDTVPTDFQAHDPGFIVAGQNPALTSAWLKMCAKNLLHLYGRRPPQVYSTYFKPTHNNTSTFTEVGRYKVTLGPDTIHIRGRFNTWCTHGGVGNEVRVLVDGVVKETFTAIAAQGSTQTWATITGLTGGSEIIITVEAKSTAAGADWGTIVDGVFAWEYAQNLDYPTTMPANYVPIDEDAIGANDTVLESHFKTLADNILWLANNRVKNLVQDWRHRTYRRVGISGGEINGQGDWTRGDEGSITQRANHMKNITVFAQTSQADQLGNTTPDDRDGRGYWQYGLSSGGWTALSSWPPPASQKQYAHGKRVAVIHNSPGSTGAVSDIAGGFVRGWLRGKRRRPYIMAAFDLGSGGPGIEEPGFINNGKFQLFTGSTLIGNWPVTGRGTRPDYETNWYGPDYVPVASFGTMNLRGTLTSTRDTDNSTLEGHLFEMELNGLMFVDSPLTQTQLDAL